MVQQKDSALAKQQRRSMAQLIEVRDIISVLDGRLGRRLGGLGEQLVQPYTDTRGHGLTRRRIQQGKIESARIRVENIIRSDITTELHEILELYCELLLARIQLLDPPAGSIPAGTTTSPNHYCDPGLEEPVRSLIHAAPRTEVKELHAVRTLLVDKFGKEFSMSAVEGEGVAERVLKKLKVETPRKELVDAYLKEICRTYGVAFPGEDEEDDDEDQGSDGEGGGTKAAQELEPALEAEPGTAGNDAKKAEEVDELRRASAPKIIGPQSPLRVVPPSPSSENVQPRVKIPGAPEGTPSKKVAAPAKKADVKKNESSGPGGKIPDVDELAKRFAALKR